MAINISWHAVPQGHSGSVCFFPTRRAWRELLAEMEAQGLVYESDLARDLPDLPTWDEFHVPDDADGTPEYDAWRKACEPILTSEDADPPGLPSYKLHSGEGDVLTPREISAALTRASETPVTSSDPEFDEFWREWLEFLRAAATHGRGASIDVGGR